MGIIEKTIIISMAIVGLRIVSSKGMILHILRMPYEWLVKTFKRISKDPKSKWKLERRLHAVLDYLIFRIPIYILKPIIGCCTCMASVWTIVIEYAYFELSWWTLLDIFIVACLNSIIYALYEKLEK